MKQMMGGAITVAAVGWLLYTGFADSQCERVYRSAAPIRATFDVVRWVSHNFISQQARLEQIEWSMDADAGAQKVVGQLLYGPHLTCGE